MFGTNCDPTLPVVLLNAILKISHSLFINFNTAVN